MFRRHGGRRPGTARPTAVSRPSPPPFTPTSPLRCADGHGDGGPVDGCGASHVRKAECLGLGCVIFCCSEAVQTVQMGIPSGGCHEVNLRRMCGCHAGSIRVPRSLRARVTHIMVFSSHRNSVCNLWSHKVPVALLGLIASISRGRSRCKGLRLTKLPCIWEARSDQPGVPAFENLSMAKAVPYVVSALRVFAIKGLMPRQVISVLLWRHWRFRGVTQFCNSPDPLGAWLPRSPCGEWHSLPHA